MKHAAHPDRPSEVAFTIPSPDGTVTNVRLDFDTFVNRLASLTEQLIQVAGARRGRVPQPIPHLSEAVDCLLFQAAIDCVVGENGADESHMV